MSKVVRLSKLNERPAMAHCSVLRCDFSGSVAGWQAGPWLTAIWLVLGLLAASFTLSSGAAFGDESGDAYAGDNSFGDSAAGSAYDSGYDPYDLDSYDQGAYPLSNNDTRVYFQGGASVVRESSYDLSATYSASFDPMYARSFAFGIEQDLFSGFGINLSVSNVSQNFDQVTDSNGATWSVTGGDYRVLAVTPGLHYRLENDVLEPYIHLGLGRASYDFSGTWNSMEYANKDNALIYDFGIGVDYVTEGGLILGLYEHSQILDDPSLSDGGGVHTFGFRIGFEMQNQFF